MYQFKTKQLGLAIRLCHKLLLVMRLTTVILLASFLQVSANTFGQKVTLNLRNTPLDFVLKEIRLQSGYDIFFDGKIISSNQKIDLRLENATIKEALSKALKDLPLTFEIQDREITIKKRKETNFFDKMLDVFQNREAKGRVIDQQGKPLAGANVKVKNGNGSTVTNADGEFSLAKLEEKAILSISYIGYQTQELTAKPQMGDITLILNDSKLDEIQIVGYGVTTKRLSTGSVSTIKAADLEKQPLSNPLQALSGRLPGVYVSEASGITGSTINLVVRGRNSISANLNPLYIVDGVPFNALATDRTAGSNTQVPLIGGYLSPLDNIPTSDIESIDVLKDADATAIYGSRAANGVVIITTKRGKSGTLQVGANIYTGVSRIANSRIQFMDTEQYLSLRRKAFANDNITPTLTNAPDLSLGNGYTDFLDHIMGSTASLTDATLNASGGTKLTQYLISGNFRHQSAVLPGNFADNKGTLRFNVQTQSENGRFKLNMSSGYTKNVNTIPTYPAQTLYSLPPNLPLYNPDGSLYWNNSYTNPLGALSSITTAKTDNFLVNTNLQYTILPGLNIKADMGYNRITLDYVKATPKSSQNPATAIAGAVTLQTNFTENYSLEPQLTYSKQIGPGKMDVLLGGTYLYTNSVQPIFVMGSFTNDALFSNLGSLTASSITSGRNESKYLSGFSRLSYTIKQKYLLNFNGRRDGSSRFASGNKFGNFGSVGAGWIFSEEKFLEKIAPWVSFGKIRASYGTIGNSPTTDYEYLSTFRSPFGAAQYGGVAALAPIALANENYQWEVTRKLEMAMDLNFIKDRIAFTGSWYRNRSDNLLVSIPIASQTGFASYIGNLPALVQNTGLEFTLDSKNIAGKSFSWSTSVNITIPKNKLLRYDNLAMSTNANNYVVGQPLSVVQAFRFTGFDNGIAKFQDLDGNGTISTGSYATTGRGDYQVVGYTDPKFFGGINNSLTYKGFQLDFLFSFVKKDGYNIYNNLSIPGSANNTIDDILDKPFTYTTLTANAPATAFNQYRTSNATFGDASFIRLKNVNLNYTVKQGFAKKIGFKNLNIYLRGQNLLTFTNYLGIDPETLGTTFPPIRLYTIGLQATL